ncbi:MAG TPA: ABC transporter permease [Anaerolineae bacterium]|nr:ABC transporter permease [Anaerolineae bacterium]
MGRYLLRRVLHGVVVLLGVSVIVFLLMHLGGDPVAVLLPLDAPPEQVAAFRQEMGFDRPLPVQYALFLSRAVRGDFGYSYHYRTDALSIVLERMPATLKLTAAAMAIALAVAIPAGILSALKQGSVLDMVVRVSVLLGQAVPGFWLALVLIMVFGVKLRWLPVSGAEGWRSIVLPAIVTGSFSMATVTRLLRCNLVETMAETYIQVARGKGVPENLIVTRHALKNAAIPTITVIGLQMGWLLGGAVISEAVFAYPGMGRLAVTAIGYRDVPVIQSFVAIMAIIVVTINLGVDILYGWADPRIRLYE